MPQPAGDLWTWARHHLFLSTSREAWEDRLGGLVLLLGGAGLLLFARDLPLSRQVLLWGLLLAVLAVLLRRGMFRLFGPVLFYDLVRSTRRGRYFLLRFLYVVGLGLLICWFYWAFSIHAYDFTGKPPTIRDQADFAEKFFLTFMWVQFLVVVLLTPAYTAGAVADEKDRRTLEFLLATDLHNREIILGKWTARVGNLALLLLAGLPILAMNLFLGGVDPDLMVAGFVATALTLVSLASLSILLSVHARRARDAIVLTYLVLAAYYALSTTGTILTLSLPAFGNRGIYVGDFSLTVADVANWLSAGNIFVALVRLMIQMGFGGGVTSSLPDLLRDYAVFHGLVTLGCVGLAVLQLRSVALRQTAVVKAAKRGRGVGGAKPAVGKYPPMIWKEVFADAGMRFRAIGRIVILLLVALSFLPLVMMVYFFFEYGSPISGNWDEFGDATNRWVRSGGMLVGCLIILGVGVRAAGSVGNERDKQTLDGLLTTPLTTTDILWAKWLGAMTSVRWGLAWVALIWVIGAGTGGLHPLLLFVLLLAWLVYAGAVGMLGLWFSVVSKTTMRATLWTVLTTIGASIGHWVLWSCCLPFFMFGRGAGSFFDKGMEVVLKLQMGLSPPVTLSAMLPWRVQDFTRDYGYRNEDFSPATMIGYALFGVVVWALAGVGLWTAVTTRFSRMTARSARRPEGVVRQRAGPERVHPDEEKKV